MRAWCAWCCGVALPGPAGSLLQLAARQTARSLRIRESSDPFFKQLRTVAGEAPQWNFHKYLIAPDGKKVYSFRSQVESDSREFMSKLSLMLKSADGGAYKKQRGGITAAFNPAAFWAAGNRGRRRRTPVD